MKSASGSKSREFNQYRNLLYVTLGVLSCVLLLCYNDDVKGVVQEALFFRAKDVTDVRQNDSRSYTDSTRILYQ